MALHPSAGSRSSRVHAGRGGAATALAERRVAQLAAIHLQMFEVMRDQAARARVLQATAGAVAAPAAIAASPGDVPAPPPPGDRWAALLRQAAALPDADLNATAAARVYSTHSCRACLSCACLVERENRAARRRGR